MRPAHKQVDALPPARIAVCLRCYLPSWEGQCAGLVYVVVAAVAVAFRHLSHPFAGRFGATSFMPCISSVQCCVLYCNCIRWCERTAVLESPGGMVCTVQKVSWPRVICVI